VRRWACSSAAPITQGGIKEESARAAWRFRVSQSVIFLWRSGGAARARAERRSAERGLSATAPKRCAQRSNERLTVGLPHHRALSRNGGGLGWRGRERARLGF